MHHLPPIPIPLGHRLRLFRVKFVPAIVFSCTLLAIILIWRAHLAPPPLLTAVTAEPQSEHLASVQ